MRVYHVSRGNAYSDTRVFTPRVPYCIGDDEDCETPRVCVSSSIMGALTATILDDDIISGKKYFMIYSAEVSEEDMITPEVLHDKYGVGDALYTQEYWITREIIMTGKFYRLVYFERDNYVFPDATKEFEIREYASQYDWYREDLSLHSILNEHGLDEDELVERFNLRGIRVFSKVRIEELSVFDDE